VEVGGLKNSANIMAAVFSASSIIIIINVRWNAIRRASLAVSFIRSFIHSWQSVKRTTSTMSNQGRLHDLMQFTTVLRTLPRWTDAGRRCTGGGPVDGTKPIPYRSTGATPLGWGTVDGSPESTAREWSWDGSARAMCGQTNAVVFPLW